MSGSSGGCRHHRKGAQPSCLNRSHFGDAHRTAPSRIFVQPIDYPFFGVTSLSSPVAKS